MVAEGGLHTRCDGEYGVVLEARIQTYWSPTELNHSKLDFPERQRSRKRRSTVKKSRFSEEQIIGILKQSEAGAKTNDLCRQHGISAASFYGWRSKYGGMEVSEAKRLKQLEEENSKLKRVVAEQVLDITMLKDLVGKKW